MIPVHLSRALILTGLAAWVCVCLTTALQANHDSRLLLWSAVSALFILAYLFDMSRARAQLPALALEGASVAAMAALLCNGYEGLLLVLVAVQLARLASSRLAITWICAQTAALGVAIAIHWSARAALLLAPPYLGFQLVMLAAVRGYADLLRAQAALADKSRIEERLRMAQDLHDSLGHHLVTLNLNLEHAAHEARGEIRETVRAAQALARALLRDVKEIVHSSRDEAPVDLPLEIHRLAAELPRPKLHVTCPSDLRLEDPRTGRAMLRAVQEIVTNSIRHGEAENLWLSIERTPAELRLAARDDGRASQQFEEGFGLSGMRRRLEALGGTLSAESAPGGGFHVCAALPCAPGTPE
jgi:signal transduction histidine kinase